ncbi:hypothetical protein HNY73_016692 [Argiope bruennichi]|uniref:Integrase catalytic domain-containing protein n=1 Tax=Argiope bruennichi TaxID=94029 RepID=A0A8T0EKQ9_ARGBR|nr:hypothetical protein HNY73_016692 [Argiope bruennichi]
MEELPDKRFLLSEEEDFCENHFKSTYRMNDQGRFVSNQPMPKKDPLSALCPFIDKDGLLRVGGRLQNASLQYNAKHPIILPNQHKLSILIVQYFHILNLQACGNLLIDLEEICQNKKMGDLPERLVTLNRPFFVCGIDYAGPISILKHLGRGAKTMKGYIAVFAWFATKVLDLELVTDYTSDSFIAALKRFCSRRSTPKHIQSENGTNFFRS